MPQPDEQFGITEYRDFDNCSADGFAYRLDQAIKNAGTPPRGVNVKVRGQVGPMKQTLTNLESFFSLGRHIDGIRKASESPTERHSDICLGQRLVRNLPFDPSSDSRAAT